MKIASFHHRGALRFGVVRNDEVLDASALPGAPAGVRELLARGDEGLAWLRAAIETAPRLPLADVKLAAPVPAPRKFLGLGGNYASHLEEAAKLGLVRPPGQVWFNKQVSCVAGPFDEVHRPRVSAQFDYEGELGVVIGRRCRHVRAEEAMAMVAGYVVINDMSVRDWQLRAPTHTLGKSFDTHGPFGPWLVTRDEIADPHALRLRTWVNGELRQDGNTAQMIHRIEAMLVELSTAFTLEPGDVLSTGSPAGVGGLMDPPRYLVAGDVVRVEIEGIGHIENRVVEEPLETAR
ncbi:5-carboxymethyl-2-hydroxymuconate isomerase [Variovorax paradoxus]|jgi:2-keto-4-pentenoate hydratase/2-oxohepta-3-ene-1,7-dioic acid hydratase in catechol pathway|uniref:fumarylacetoacetate hydrolase family protein n=1 Tax=Variovorax paradoxus TaxID=34073 RepID=UPI0006E5CD33|nr:5-carboxymethyl-2-hydroxymuconate isomerase [Variovorax paradoxus]KPV06524.1 5-carboxymethyl-2-hydroxymuconate isomerase [Variovorax paradoxus]KPV08430.1 5-carboxymethyl-2-hydroxymuconate isomerase [Variovorax paradoxus]KPV21965.1 5-carboxymethyl-2-hydroxymuconate isomerase [Variovorax paradoxus]KPV32017.1 5-carboxymethyl-2-hydroxymuconate isomerase [Variovorax paradoxus]